MQYSLMQAILNYLIDNRNEFNLHNATTKSTTGTRYRAEDSDKTSSVKSSIRIKVKDQE